MRVAAFTQDWMTGFAGIRRLISVKEHNNENHLN